MFINSLNIWKNILVQHIQKRYSLCKTYSKHVSGGSQEKYLFCTISTAQKIKSSIKDFFSICDQIHRKLRIWSHLLK